MDKKFALGVALVALVLLAYPFLPGLLERFAAHPGTVVDSSPSFPQEYPLFAASRSCFYSPETGRYWAFYRRLGEHSFYYISSPDGVHWSSPVLIDNSLRGGTAWPDGRYVHVAYMDYNPNYNPNDPSSLPATAYYYMRGLLRSDGTILWGPKTFVAPVQDIDSPPVICVDDQGYVWVLSSDEGWWRMKLVRSSAKGEWAPGGPSFTLEGGLESMSSKPICPYPGGRVVVGLRSLYWESWGWTGVWLHCFLLYIVGPSGVELFRMIPCKDEPIGYNYAVASVGRRVFLASAEGSMPEGSESAVAVLELLEGRPPGQDLACRYRVRAADLGMENPVALTVTPAGGLALFYMRDRVSTICWERTVMVRSPDGIHWGPEETIQAREEDEPAYLFCDAPYHAYAGKIPFYSLSYDNRDNLYKAWMWAVGVPVPPPPPPPKENENVPRVENNPPVVPSYSATGYWFSSDRGCVMLIHCTFDNGDLLPDGASITAYLPTYGQVGVVFGYSEFVVPLKRMEPDVWFATLSAGAPVPSKVVLDISVPGMTTVRLIIPLSHREFVGNLLVQVVDAETGSGIDGATVVCGQQTSRTSGGGFARFQGVPSGTVPLSCYAQGYYSFAGSVRVNPNALNTAVVRLYPAEDNRPKDARIVVSVLGIDPKSGATLRIDPMSAAVTVDGESCAYDPALGRWAKGVPAGEHSVTAWAPGYYAKTLVARVPPGETVEVEVALEPSSEGPERFLLYAKVVDRNGLPVVGAKVLLDTGASGTTGHDGLCVLSAPSGTRSVTASHPGYFDATKRVEVRGPASVTLTLRGVLYEAPAPPPVFLLYLLAFLLVLAAGVFLWRRK